MKPRHADVIVGAGAGVLALAVYAYTLAPGLIDIRDTPAFQYVGRILGVPHQPGYPFYLLISWAFSHLPIGTLAYRMNLLSAVFGAGTVMVTCVVLRRAGCRKTVAAGAALAAGFGPVTWSQCLIAEVYSLESLLIAATLLALLLWHDGRRAAAFYAAAFLFGLAVAHHPNDLLLAPAVLAFVWLTDRRWILDLRRASLAAALAAAAFLPYAYLIIRTSQQAAYVLEPAHGLADLARIVSGAGYRVNVFPFSLDAVLTSRIPMAASMIAADVTVPGCVAAVAGVWSLARARHPLGLFLALGIAGLLAFVLNYDIPDIAVFFIPVFLLAWVAAGRGVEAAVRTLAGRAPRWERVAGAACALVPLWFVAAHGHEVSLRGRVATMRWADGLFAQIHTPAVFLEEDWVIDQVVRYKTLGEGLPPGRVVGGPAEFVPVNVDRWLQSGTRIYAFRGKAGALRLMGWPVDREVVRLSFNAFVESQRPGTTIAIAAPAERSGAILGGGRATLRMLGLGAGRDAGLYAAYAGLGVRGAAAAGIEALGPLRAALQASRGERVGATAGVAPADLAISASGGAASILVGGREIVRTTRGIALAAWSPDGNLRDVRVLQGESELTVPLEHRTVFTVRGARRCAALDSTGPADVTPLAGSGVVSLQFPSPGRIVLAGSAGDVDGAHMVDTMRGSQVSVSIEKTAGGNEAVFTSAGNQGMSVVLASLNRIPNRVTARWEGQAAEREAGRVCAVDTGGLLEIVDDRTFGLGMANDEQAILMGAGWSRPEPSPGGPVRRTARSDAVVLVPLPPGVAWTVRVAAAPVAGLGAGPPTMTLSVDGEPLGVRPMAAGWQTLEWTIPPSIAGRTREIAVRTSSPAVVGSLRFSRE